MKTKSIILILLAISIFVMNCGNDVAGGAGAGNPATMAVFAESAIDSSSLLRCSSREIVLSDSGKALITVNEVYINVDSMKLYSENDSSIFGSGPFSFELINGTTTAANPIDTIPDGIYNKVRFCFPAFSDSVYQIKLVGSIIHEDIKREVDIYIYVQTCVAFDSEEPIEISGGNSVNLAVLMNDKEWFSDVNIKGVYNHEEVFIDSLGNLNIYDTKDSTGPNGQLALKIRENILNSGVFVTR